MKTVTRYRNAGRTKIYDDAMLWLLLGFAEYPVVCVIFQAKGLLKGLGVAESFSVWRWLWRFNATVWESL